MDFYQQQQAAHRSSRLLILLYVAGVLTLGLLSSLWLSLLLMPLKLLFAGPESSAFNTSHFLWMACVVMMLCLIISYGRYQSLKRGGLHIAKALGAHRLPLTANNLKEQQFRNVVEEMALASGLPVPALFVQQQERGINSFAAGMGIFDAVIVVTQGALEALDRDELQAMVAHEFSHIRHGDIRLNLQLAAAMSGLLLIAELAEQLNQSPGSCSSDAFLSKAPSRVTHPLHSSCYVLGYGGVFFSELIKAAVNRQREVLADAAAVQYTRNPRALASALKKVAGHPYASLIFHPARRTFSHLFFAQGLDSNFAGALATHPPLSERIRALEPDWDGQYIRNLIPMPHSEYREQSDLPIQQRSIKSRQELPANERLAIPNGTRPLDLDAPQEWLPLIPTPLLEAAHHQQGAQAVLYSLLISSDLVIRHRQLTLLPNPHQVEALTGFPLAAPLQLGLVELCLSTLQQLDHSVYSLFMERLQKLIDADGEESLFEWLLGRLIAHQMTVMFSLPESQSPIIRQIELLAAEMQVLVSCIAQHSTDNTAAAQHFVMDFAARLPIAEISLQQPLTFAQAAQALCRLQQAAPRIKLQFIQALAAIMAQDGKISDEEFTLFRVLALCLGCPIPPPQAGLAIPMQY